MSRHAGLLVKLFQRKKESYVNIVHENQSCVKYLEVNFMKKKKE